MHIISHKRLVAFSVLHPEVATALDHWYRLTKQGTFRNFAELKAIFSTSDQVHDLTVFNIGGNKVRLIAIIRYNSQTLFIRDILTHAEYDTGKWKG